MDYILTIKWYSINTFDDPTTLQEYVSTPKPLHEAMLEADENAKACLDTGMPLVSIEIKLA